MQHFFAWPETILQKYHESCKHNMIRSKVFFLVVFCFLYVLYIAFFAAAIRNASIPIFQWLKEAINADDDADDNSNSTRNAVRLRVLRRPLLPRLVKQIGAAKIAKDEKRASVSTIDDGDIARTTSLELTADEETYIAECYRLYRRFWSPVVMALLVETG